MSALLGCPFCGGEAYIVQRMEVTKTDARQWYEVGCTECGMGLLLRSKVLRENAIAAWNRRVKEGDTNENSNL